MLNNEYWKSFHDSRVAILEREAKSELALNGRGGYPIPMFFERTADIMNKVGHGETCRLFDIGCGTGLMDWIMAPFYREIVGIDNSEEMIRYGTTKYPTLDLVKADAINIDALDGCAERFDKCVCGVLQFLDTDECIMKVLQNTYGILKPGGKCLFYDLQDDTKRNEYVARLLFMNDDIIDKRMDLESRRLWFNSEALIHMARKVGFAQVACARVDVKGMPQAEYFFDMLVRK